MHENIVHLQSLTKPGLLLTISLFSVDEVVWGVELNQIFQQTYIADLRPGTPGSGTLDDQRLHIFRWITEKPAVYGHRLYDTCSLMFNFWTRYLRLCW